MVVYIIPSRLVYNSNQTNLHHVLHRSLISHCIVYLAVPFGLHRDNQTLLHPTIPETFLEQSHNAALKQAQRLAAGRVHKG